jgi:hypothetical protein
MNDFTKDELEELLLGYEMHSHNTRHNWPSLDLCKKIKSMIDNYCEHDPHGDFHVCVDKCKKCGVIINDNQ